MHAKSEEITDLEQLLDRIDEASCDKDEVALADVMEAIGTRSFAPLILLPGLVAVVPGVGDIPGVTTAMAIFVFLVAVQLLFRRRHLWLPQWLVNRSIARDKLCKGVDWMRRPAGFIDRFLRPRLKIFANRYAIAAACVVVALVMPLMEVVPFGAIAAGVALIAFGLALVAHDGLLALLAFAATATTLGVAIYGLL